MSTLADLLDAHADTVMRRWAERADAPLASTDPRGPDRPALLRSLVAALRGSPSTPDGPTERSLDPLRALVLELAREHRVAVSLDDVQTLLDFFAPSADAAQAQDRRQVEGLARQREVLESMGDAFFALDKDWRFTLVNRHYERLTHHPREEAIGKLFWDLHPAASDPDTLYYQQYHRCMAERVPAQFVDYYAPLDLWTEVSAYPTSDGGLSVFFRDVSAQRRASGAIHASEKRYRSIFNSIEDGFCIVEVLFDDQGQPVDYRFLEVNGAFERQTGLHDAAGKRIREFVPDLDEHWFRLYGTIVTTGESASYENEAAAMGRWFEVTASRVDPPELRQVAIVFKDITARKKADLQRERLIRDLGKTNSDLDQFAYVTSHDLKTPLRGIASLSQWIEDDLGDAASDETKQNLHLMRVRVQRLEALINGILSYSTAGRSKHRPEPVDVGKMLAESAGLLSLPSSVTLVVVAPMPTLLVERVPFQQVFMHMISNAVKYAQRPDPRVQIGATEEGASVHFTVTDNGPGIAPEFHERIWALFQKLESRSTIEGTGIGLSIVKKIVETRGGKTWVESRLGQGTTFHIVWPRQPVVDEADLHPRAP